MEILGLWPTESAETARSDVRERRRAIEVSILRVEVS
jgi:hypothetical protein